MDGAILTASVDGIEYIKFIGTIRYSHCGGLESHVDQLFARGEPVEIAIDLVQAEILDSTALGLLARIAIESKKYDDKKPVIFLKQGELNNIIKRVCFDQVFELVFQQNGQNTEEFQRLDSAQQNEEAVLQRVLKAHKNLAEINEDNETLFTDITHVLQ